MKNIFQTTAILTAMSAGSVTHAQGAGDWYASLFGGLSVGGYEIDDYSGSGDTLELSGDGSFIVGLTVGRSIAPNIRAEIELSYADYEIDTYDYNGLSGDIDGFDFDATYLMGNVWYDISNIGAAGAIAPYVGGGLGLGLITTSVFGTELDTGNALAYQIGAGVQMPVASGKIDIGYRYKGTAGFTAEFDGADVGLGDVTADSHNLQVGYVMSF